MHTLSLWHNTRLLVTDPPAEGNRRVSRYLSCDIFNVCTHLCRYKVLCKEVSFSLLRVTCRCRARKHFAKGLEIWDGTLLFGEKGRFLQVKKAPFRHVH